MNEIVVVTGIFWFFVCMVCNHLKIGKGIDTVEWYIIGIALAVAWWMIIPAVLFFYTINKLAHALAVRIVAWYER